MKESDLYPKVSKLFFDKYYIIIEYKIPDKSKREIDVLCISKYKNNTELIAVEAKINNWKKVLNQAFTRLFYVDKCYIAVPHDNIKKINTDILKREGIGLISVDNRAKVIIKARKSNLTFKWRRELILKDVFHKIQYDCP